MRGELAAAAFLILLTVQSLIPGAEDVSVGVERPTPRLWAQWQPQADSSDPRLDRIFVSVWERESTVGDLLSRLSEESAVQLTAVEDILSVRVTVFAKRSMLSGVMSALAQLCYGYWVYERGRAPVDRAYVLVRHEAQPHCLDELRDHPFVELAEPATERLRSDLQTYLSLYETALFLSGEELRQRHREAHPLVCANLLDPETRPLIQAICGMDGTQREELLTTGLAEIPLRQVDAEWRQHLVDKAIGSEASRRHRETEGADSPPDYSVAILRWSGLDVQVFLQSSEGRSSMLGQVTFVPLVSPAELRRRLSEVGYWDAASDSGQEAADDGDWWVGNDDVGQALAESGHPVAKFFYAFFSDGDPDLDRRLPASDQANPSLSTPLDLSGLEGDSLPLAALLEQAARRCHLRVVAHHLPPEDCTISRWRVETPEASLGALLNALRQQQNSRDWAVSWSFVGRYLVIRQEDVSSIRRQAEERLWESHPALRNALEDFFELMFLAALASSSR